ncbi:MAG: NPCBM/NEW2 domain-containing protein [Thermoguttaceae bacterium]|nr:NPCBM/NEW2 domain-containing protein [Thermoguttaceae bacterium]MDW8037754.1 NPCBM/NEW2 domain-containing protein [Thermoguttaceae bacterium]
MGYVIWVWLVVSATSNPPEVELRTLDGQVHRGGLAALSEQTIGLQTSTGPVQVPLERVAELLPKSPPAARPVPSVWVHLVDGSRVAVQEFLLEGEKVRLQLLGSDQPLECARADVAWVRLQPETETLAPAWKKLLQTKTDTDVLVLRTDQALDYHRGVIHGVGADTIQFELDRERIPVKRGRVFGLIFRHPEGRTLPAPVGIVHDVTGSQWYVQKIVLEGQVLRWTSPVGLTGSTRLEDLVRLDFSEGKIVYLSDLEPMSVRWTPFFGPAEIPASQAEFFAPRKDRALEPRPIQLGGKKYNKGLAIHSRTEIVYRLPRPFRRLQAVVGIDDQIRPAGHVQLIIRGDEKVLLEEAISGTQPPKPIDLDITGVRRLVILVDFGQDMDIGDHLLLGDIKLVQ